MKNNLLIPKRNSICSCGEETFQEEAVYFSQLIENKGLFERKDYCITCWKKVEKREGASLWKGKTPTKKPDLMRPDRRIIELFRDLVEDQEDLKLLYILTQLMVRKKILYKTRADFYELLLTGEVFHVRTFILKTEETEQIAERLKNYLDD